MLSSNPGKVQENLTRDNGDWLRQLVALENANGATEGREFHFGEAGAYATEKAFGVFGSAVANSV